MHRNLCAACKSNEASNFGANFGGIGFSGGDEAATIDLTLINHARHQPSGTNARNADSVHNPGDKEITFNTKIGPLQVKAKFLPKEMIFDGKLAL